MRRDTARSDRSLDIRVVVALVEAQMLGTSRPTRTAENNRVERIGDEPFVVNVRARDHGSERNSAAICPHMALDAPLRAIGGVWTCQVPPFGALTIALSSDAHFHWIPRRLS